MSLSLCNAAEPGAVVPISPTAPTASPHLDPSAHVLHVVQPLPARYRLREVLAFHQRDAQQIAECVTHPEGTAPCLYKAIDWEGAPAWLALQWHTADAAPHAAATLHLPHPAPADALPRWAAVVRRMLGLAYPSAAFEAAHAQHPQLGALLQAQAGLHVPAAPSVWEALTWAITGQQISVAAAVALRRRLIVAAGTPLNTPGAPVLTAYPSAAQVAALGAAGLRAVGYSHSKTQALLHVAEQVANGTLPLAQWTQASDAGTLALEQVDAISAQLQAVPGIGPWTVHYTLLRGLGWPDGSLHGDVAVRKALAPLLGCAQMTPAATREWLAPLAPWRALVAAHLWASLSSKAY